jgi:hypothetical protein
MIDPLQPRTDRKAQDAHGELARFGQGFHRMGAISEEQALRPLNLHSESCNNIHARAQAHKFLKKAQQHDPINFMPRCRTPPPLHAHFFSRSALTCNGKRGNGLRTNS